MKKLKITNETMYSHLKEGAILFVKKEKRTVQRILITKSANKNQALVSTMSGKTKEDILITSIKAYINPLF